MAYSLLEDLSLGKPAISPALQDLRRYMYTLVKERGHVTVTEYGRTSTENFHVVEVRPLLALVSRCIHFLAPLSSRKGGGSNPPSGRSRNWSKSRLIP